MKAEAEVLAELKQIFIDGLQSALAVAESKLAKVRELHHSKKRYSNIAVNNCMECNMPYPCPTYQITEEE